MAKEKVIYQVDVDAKKATSSISAFDKELTDLKKEILQNEKALGKLNKEIRQSDKVTDADAKAKQRLEGRLKKLRSEYNKTQKQSQGLNKGIGRLAKGFASGALQVIAFTGGITALVGLVSNSIEKFGEQEKAQKALEVALGRTSKNLLNQASALQQVTKFGDESIIQGQAFLAQMGLTEDQISRLTPSILDFAEAQGLNLDDAFKLVAKSVGSSTNALSRYGIQIEGAVGSTVRTQSAVDSLTEAFAGQAEAAAGVGTGALTQFQNAVGDLQEKLGGLVLEGLNPFLQGLTSFIGDLSPKTSEQLQEQRINANLLVSEITSLNEGDERRSALIQELTTKYPAFNKLLVDEKTANSDLLEVLDEVNDAYLNRIAFEVAGEELAEAEADLVGQTKILIEAQKIFNEELLDSGENGKALFDELNQLSRIERLDRITELFDSGALDEFGLGVKNTGQLLKSQQNTVKEFEENLFGVREEARQIQAELEGTFDVVDDANTNLDGGVETDGRTGSGTPTKPSPKIDEEGFFENLQRELELEAEAFEQKRQQEIEEILKTEEAVRKAQSELAEELAEEDDPAEDPRLQQAIATTTALLEIEKDFQEQKQALQQQAVTATANILGQGFIALAQNSEEGLKEFGRASVGLLFDLLQKVVAIKTAEATAIALAQPDSVATFGISGLARSVVIGGLIQGALAGLKSIVLSGFRDGGLVEGGVPAFRSGGFVTGSGSGVSDSVNARLSAGEFVMPADKVAQPSVFQLLESIRQTDFDAEQNRIDNKIRSRTPLGRRSDRPFSVSVSEIDSVGRRRSQNQSKGVIGL